MDRQRRWVHRAADDPSVTLRLRRHLGAGTVSMAELKVAMLIQAYAPHVGGAERQLQALLPLLRRRGVEGMVWTREHPDSPARERMDGTWVRRFSAPAWTPKPMRSVLYTGQAVVELARWRPDVVHAHELLSPTTTALFAKSLLGTPTVSKVLRGGTLGDVAKLRRTSNGRRRLRAIAARIDAFAVISREIDGELDEAGVPKYRRHFIPNGVSTTRFAPPPHDQRIGRRLARGIADSRPVAVYAGRLVPEKRVDLLLDAWEAVVRRLPEARLWIVGDGPCADALMRRGVAGVEFVGRVENVDELLPLGDVFVLPSDTEGLSNAILEAMASGLPIVATDVGGASDLIAGGASGIVVPPGDAQRLSEALVQLLSAPEDVRREMGAKARDIVVASYSIEGTAGRLASLYRSLTRLRHRR